jgi:hypothetical protein
MVQPTTQQEQGATAPLPIYFKILRICFATCIALRPLAFLLYSFFDPTGRSGADAIAANATANPFTNQAHLPFLDFILNLHLVTLWLLIGCIPSAVAMLNFTNGQKAIHTGEQPAPTNL